MKKAKIFILEVAILLALLLGTVVFASAQINKNAKIDQSKINSKVIINTPTISNSLLTTKQLPVFSNIKPINLIPNQKNIKQTDLKPIATIPVTNLVVKSSSINGTMTPRDPYHSSLAYIEILSGDVFPATNEVDCACGGGLTYIKLVLQATAGKRYLVTTNVSPKRTDNFGLSIFSSGFVHTESVIQEKQDVSVVLSPQSSGVYELWMQCSDPNSGRRTWKFHSMTVEELD
ncbi:MAG: hypothetical protein AAF502_12280 [Bacteroidota bacterium]